MIVFEKINYPKEEKYLAKEVVNFGLKELKIKKPPYIFYSDFMNNKLEGKYLLKENKIVINLMFDKERIIKTFFHELAHAKQFQEGWLKTKNVDGVVFRFWKKNKIHINTKFCEKQQENLDFDKYFNSPHEIQARAISNNLFNKLCNQTQQH